MTPGRARKPGRAANDAMDALDDALAGLHKLRQALVGEIRASDDATAVITMVF